MPAKDPKYTTIVANQGLRVHAVAWWGGGSTTACGRPFSGWKLSPKKLNCRDCKLQILKQELARRSPR